ncbi:uncharacterized protein METZ01_LOCUS431106, partial [marine metagenome]
LIYRLPKNISVITPRSFCPKCEAMIPFYRNIPIVSFIIQLGKCGNCSNRISFLYPIIEILSAIALVFSVKTISYPESLSFYWMFTSLLVLTIIDQKWMQVPTTIIISMAFGLLCYHLIWTVDLMVPISGTIIGLGFISFVVAFNWFIFHKQTMGLGDLFIIAILGAWLGPIQIFIAIVLSSILALIVFISLSFMEGFNRSKALPFIPYLSFSSIITYLINPL